MTTRLSQLVSREDAALSELEALDRRIEEGEDVPRTVYARAEAAYRAAQDAALAEKLQPTLSAQYGEDAAAHIVEVQP